MTRDELEAVIWRHWPTRGTEAARAVDAILAAADTHRDTAVTIATAPPADLAAVTIATAPPADLADEIARYLPRASAYAVDAITIAAHRHATALAEAAIGRKRLAEATAEYYRGGG